MYMPFIFQFGVYKTGCFKVKIIIITLFFGMKIKLISKCITVLNTIVVGIIQNFDLFCT